MGVFDRGYGVLFWWKKYIPSLVDYVGTMSCGLMWGVLWTLGWLIPGLAYSGVGAVFGHAL